jgi:hypothetical protein
LFIWKTAIIWFEGAALPTILYFLTILNTGEFSDISLKRVFSLHPFTKLSLSLFNVTTNSNGSGAQI